MNSNIQKILVAAILSLTATQALAGIDAIKASNKQIGVQYVSTNVDYTEKVDGLIADTEKGQIPGFGLSISMMKDLFFGNDYFYASFTRLNGDTRYTGSSYVDAVYPTFYVPGQYGTLQRSDSFQATDFTARYGKGIEFNQTFLMTPYVEAGYHEWHRGIGKSPIDTYGSTPITSEKYTNGHFGVGLMGQLSPISNLVLTANALVGRTIGADILVKGAGTSPSTASTGSQGLGNSTIYRFGVSADYAFTEKVHGNIGVDYTSFDYGKSNDFIPSNTNTAIYEPNSESSYTTIKLGVGYAF